MRKLGDLLLSALSRTGVGTVRVSVSVCVDLIWRLVCEGACVFMDGCVYAFAYV